jgi:hypothetical protein
LRELPECERGDYGADELAITFLRNIVDDVQRIVDHVD